MPNGNRGKRRSYWRIVLSVGAVVAVALGVWLWTIKLGYNDARQYQPQEQAEGSGGVCIEPFGMGRLCFSEQVPSKAEQQRSDDDLRAQQEMADWAFVVALVSAAGFIVSLSGVALVYATFRKTGDAVDAANRTADDAQRIGEAQVRAYLYCKSARYKLGKDSVEAIIQIGNAGQSPAQKVTLRGKCYFYSVVGHMGSGRVINWVESSVSKINGQVVGVEGVVTEHLFFFPSDFPDLSDERFENGFDGFKAWNEIRLEIVIGWEDVFSRPQRIPVNLDASIAASPASPKKRRSRAGVLSLRTEEHLLTGVDDDEGDQTG